MTYKARMKNIFFFTISTAFMLNANVSWAGGRCSREIDVVTTRTPTPVLADAALNATVQNPLVSSNIDREVDLIARMQNNERLAETSRRADDSYSEMFWVDAAAHAAERLAEFYVENRDLTQAAHIYEHAGRFYAQLQDRERSLGAYNRGIALKEAHAQEQTERTLRIQALNHLGAAYVESARREIAGRNLERATEFLHHAIVALQNADATSHELAIRVLGRAIQALQVSDLLSACLYIRSAKEVIFRIEYALVENYQRERRTR